MCACVHVYVHIILLYIRACVRNMSHQEVLLNKHHHSRECAQEISTEYGTALPTDRIRKRNAPRSQATAPHGVDGVDKQDCDGEGKKSPFGHPIQYYADGKFQP